MTKSTAQAISDIMISASHQLTGTLALVEAGEAPDVVERHREALSRILFEILTGVLNPIYAEHPELKPPELEHDESDCPE